MHPKLHFKYARLQVTKDNIAHIIGVLQLSKIGFCHYTACINMNSVI